MNILHIISAPASGGAEVYVKDLVENLADKGHNMHVAFLSSAADAGRDLDYESKFLSGLDSAGVQYFVIGNETRKKLWLGVKRITSYVKKHDIDLCHTHMAYGIAFSILLRVPVVYTHHNITQRWNKRVYKLFNKVVDEYIGISDICASALHSYTDRHVTTIHNAVSLDKFDGLTRVRVPKDCLSIAMIGRLNQQKDYFNIFKALSLLDQQVLEQITVSIAGEGKSEYKYEMINDLESKNLTQSVNLIGVTDDIPQFLYDADLFVMSSAWEGLPIALTEATISGLPCIVTDVGGCSEVIEKSNNGIVVEPKDAQALAEAITTMVTNKTQFEKYSQNALDNIDQYSIDTASSLHLILYRSLT